MRLLVKIGGAQLEQREARAELARALARARAAGHELVLVHGGGNQIRELVRRLDLPESYHEGLRVTDAATAGIVLQVLCGLVNKELVDELNRAGLAPVGLCGADGQSFSARQLRLPGVELGFVGEVAEIDATLLELLLGRGYLPVLATCAPLARQAQGSRAHFYNVNADMAAGPLGAALRADAILFLTDVPGVLDQAKRLVPELDAARAGVLRASDVVRGGMIPKLDAAFAALAAHPAALVKIAPASGADCVLAALSKETGTAIVGDLIPHG